MSLATLPERRSIWPTPPRWSIWSGRRSGIDPIEALLDGSEFYAPLTHSLILTRGTGSATFTRATKAWEFGYAAAANSGADQVLIEVASGVARFGGARYDSGTWYNTYADGSTISASSLLGYHAENARTNSLLYSRDLTFGVSASTATVWLPSTSGAELLTNGDFGTSDLTGWTNASIGAGSASAATGELVLVSADTSNRGGVRQAITCTIGQNYVITATCTAITGGSVYVGVNADTAFSGVGTSLLTATGTKSASFVATATTMYIKVWIPVATATTVAIDNISVKAAGMLPTLTATGIDNAANSASTLTAGAADATILQTLSLAAAARSFSAYVKRRTGTGNVYITRDGGTSWTDITSNLGASWTRVKIENTSVLNPSVGFKIATSGDAIDVDVCQDEAGAFVSSPIITTTAAVTRNADVLSYTEAANVDTTQGSFAFTSKPDNKTDGSDYASTFCIRNSATTTQNLVSVYHDPSENYTFAVKSGNIDYAIITDATVNTNTQRKYSGAWASNDARFVVDGGLVGSDSSVTTPVGMDQIQPGVQNNTAGFVYTRDVYVWKSALTTAQLQQVTA